jgi:hypothetical protein
VRCCVIVLCCVYALCAVCMGACGLSVMAMFVSWKNSLDDAGGVSGTGAAVPGSLSTSHSGFVLETIGWVLPFVPLSAIGWSARKQIAHSCRALRERFGLA